MIKPEPAEYKDFAYKFGKRMQLMGFKCKSEEYHRVFSTNRNRLWESLLKHIHPASEVEHVVKNLAIKKYQNKLMLNHQLGAKLSEKKEEIKLEENRFEQTKQELKALECKANQEKERIHELNKKVLVFKCKKADLTNSLQYYGDILATAQLLQKHNESRPADVIEAQLLACGQDLAQFHRIMREKGNQQDLKTLREPIISQIRSIPIIESWGTLMKQMEYQTQELASAEYGKDLLQDFENIKSLKKAYKSAMDNFLIAYVSAHRKQTRLAKQFELRKEVHNTLLDSTIQLILERFKFDSSSGREAEIRKWLTMKLKCERKKVEVETCKEELSKLKTEKAHADLMSKEETEDLKTQIQMKVNTIRMTVPWLQDSLKQLEIVHSKLQKLTPEITKLCTQEDKGLKEMERAVRSMHSITEQEMNLFMALPLDKLIHSPKELEKHQLVHYNSICSNAGSSFMTFLDGAPNITTQGILLGALEKKCYRYNLKRICLEQAKPLIEIDKNEIIKADEDGDEAILQNLRTTYFSFEMNSKMLLEQIENNFNEWVEHPMQNAVIHKVLEGKTFEDWMYKYDRALEDTYIPEKYE